MSDSLITQNEVSPADWTVADLRERVVRLQAQVPAICERIGVEATQVSEWAAQLPTRHHPDPVPVRLGDLATSDLQAPLSLARRVSELSQLLEQADALAQTLMAAVVHDSGIFAPTEPNRTATEAPAPLPEPDTETRQRQVSLIGHCHSDWDDQEAFERQRQAIRQVMTFDGHQTWFGTLDACLNDTLPGWHAVLTAVDAGAHVEIQAATAVPDRPRG